MNFSLNALGGTETVKENSHSSTKNPASQAQRTRQRTVLGVLSENEQRARSQSQSSQFSRHSSLTSSSQHSLLSCTSSSSYDVFVEEACEVAPPASGQEAASDGDNPGDQSDALKNEGARLLLELSLGSCQDVSIDSEHKESQASGVVQSHLEYAGDIYWNLRQNEVELRPLPDYAEKHPEITCGMRFILVDWLVEVALEFKLHSETVFLAVNYVDRLLSSTALVKRRKLQLVGTAALMIAAKHEEISPPELNEFVYVTDSTYSSSQLILMERFLLKALSFKMTAATARTFLSMFLLVQPVSATTENLAMYVSELSLLEMEPFLQYKPSLVAASAFCLANYTVSRSLWPSALQAFTGYSLDEIQECLIVLYKMYLRAESLPHLAIRDKYKSSRYCQVSLIPAPATLPFQ
ncbi:cyclin-A1 [Eucyclogobius newberryi]|uniref:cyclin-A1 n=1 Tax=Eucyclogobius newberryi TaxID=166745 RepID=UPI003B5BB3E1